VEGPGGRPWMLLPLGLRAGRVGTVLVWLGGKLSDYMGPLIAPDCPESLLSSGFGALWAQVRGCIPSFTFAHLERQPAHICGRVNPFLRLGARPNPSHCHRSHLQASWPAYYAGKASPRTRQTDRRKLRRLEEQGPVEFVILQGPAEIEAALPVLFSQKSRSYQELGVEDLFADPGHRDFVRRLSLSGEGMVHFSLLRVGGRIAATHWGIAVDRRFYCLLPTYERSELTVHSPGAQLRLRLMQWACENGMEIFDFTVGDEPYKARWCEVTEPLYDSLIPGSMWGVVCTTTVDGGRWLKRQVKASPTLFPLLLRLRALGFGAGPGAPEGRESQEGE
ncbi:MAG TPA: GNAT family N-acetyltransferase, partial [Myxococcota bacterium]|nr:GNAT family N-acetyltransferase [Myxococcota bacterium]